MPRDWLQVQVGLDGCVPPQPNTKASHLRGAFCVLKTHKIPQTAPAHRYSISRRPGSTESPGKDVCAQT